MDFYDFLKHIIKNPTVSYDFLCFFNDLSLTKVFNYLGTKQYIIPMISNVVYIISLFGQCVSQCVRQYVRQCVNQCVKQCERQWEACVCMCLSIYR